VLIQILNLYSFFNSVDKMKNYVTNVKKILLQWKLDNLILLILKFALNIVKSGNK
jgi:hypothetical protein